MPEVSFLNSLLLRFWSLAVHRSTCGWECRMSVCTTSQSCPEAGAGLSTDLRKWEPSRFKDGNTLAFLPFSQILFHNMNIKVSPDVLWKDFPWSEHTAVPLLLRRLEHLLLFCQNQAWAWAKWHSWARWHEATTHLLNLIQHALFLGNWVLALFSVLLKQNYLPILKPLPWLMLDSTVFTTSSWWS